MNEHLNEMLAHGLHHFNHSNEKGQLYWNGYCKAVQELNDRLINDAAGASLNEDRP